jgi:hypothetical protein
MQYFFTVTSILNPSQPVFRRDASLVFVRSVKLSETQKRAREAIEQASCELKRARKSTRGALSSTSEESSDESGTEERTLGVAGVVDDPATDDLIKEVVTLTRRLKKALSQAHASKKDTAPLVDRLQDQLWRLKHALRSPAPASETTVTAEDSELADVVGRLDLGRAN